MEGKIVIRGMSAEEIAEKKGDDRDYNSGFSIKAKCWIGGTEKVDVIAALARSLGMTLLDMMAASALVAGEGKVQPPWVSRRKEVIVRSPRDGKKVDDDGP